MKDPVHGDEDLFCLVLMHTKYSESSVFYNKKMMRGLIVLIDILFVVLGFPLERGNDDGEKLSIVH